MLAALEIARRNQMIYKIIKQLDKARMDTAVTLVLCRPCRVEQAIHHQTTG